MSLRSLLLASFQADAVRVEADFDSETLVLSSVHVTNKTKFPVRVSLAERASEKTVAQEFAKEVDSFLTLATKAADMMAFTKITKLDPAEKDEKNVKEMFEGIGYTVIWG